MYFAPFAKLPPPRPSIGTFNPSIITPSLPAMWVNTGRIFAMSRVRTSPSYNVMYSPRRNIRFAKRPRPAPGILEVLTSTPFPTVASVSSLIFLYDTRKFLQAVKKKMYCPHCRQTTITCVYADCAHAHGFCWYCSISFSNCPLCHDPDTVMIPQIPEARVLIPEACVLIS